MKQIIRTYINNKAFKNCLILVIKDLEVTRMERINDLTVLYHNDEIIGYNILNDSFSNLEDGYHPIQENLNFINQLLINANLNPLDADTESRFKVGKIIECEEHPESDHLHICKVDVGNEVLQIVCGAHNVCNGIKVVVACENAIMPNGTLITPGKLRGIDSYGMLCSEYELGLIKEHKKGLLILDESYEIGSVFEGGN